MSLHSVRDLDRLTLDVALCNRSVLRGDTVRFYGNVNATRRRAGAGLNAVTSYCEGFQFQLVSWRFNELFTKPRGSELWRKARTNDARAS